MTIEGCKKRVHTVARNKKMFTLVDENCALAQKTITTNMEIQRNIHLNRLISRRNNGMIKVVTGLRRCGKSYLLNEIFIMT